MENLTIKVGERVNIDGVDFHQVEGGFGEGKKCILAKEIANIHDKELGTINQTINRNRKFFEDGVDIIDLKPLKSLAMVLNHRGVYNKDSLNASKNIYILSESGYFKLLEIMKDRDISNNILVKEYFKSDKIHITNIRRKEILFKNLLTNMFKDICEVKVQYNVLNYRLDFYIPKYNIAIEFDENHHRNYVLEDKNRQKEIEKDLGCKFIRINEDDDNAEVFNKIMKSII